MAVDCDRELTTVTLRKRLVRPLLIGDRGEFILRHVRWFSEFAIRQCCWAFVPVTLWCHDGCGAHPTWQSLEKSDICGDPANPTEQAVPSTADHPPIVVLRRIA